MSIKTSSEANAVLEKLYRASNVRPNLWARAALGYSLSQSQDVRLLEADSNGKEMSDSTLLGDDAPVFLALLRQREGKVLSREEMNKLLKLHVERGLRFFGSEFERLNRRGDELMLRLLELGLATLEDEERDQDATRPPTQGSFEVRVPVGYLVPGNDPVYHHVNGPAATPHVAIMGKTGTGKTRTGLQMLQRLRSVTSHDVPFLVFDFAKGDIAANDQFRNETGAKVFAPPEDLIPLAPLALPEQSETAIKMAARRFVNTIGSVVRLGPIQKQRALQIVTSVYHEFRGRTPDMEYVAESAAQLYEENGWSPDSLTACLREFTDFPLFQKAEELERHPFFEGSHIIDVHRLPADLRKLTVFLVLDHLYTEIMTMKDAPLDEKKNRRQRLVIVIDEAHHYLACKQPTLEQMVREVRSKGVGIWLLSQSPDDFDQSDYNFSKEMGLSIVFACVVEKQKMLESILGGRIDTKEVSNLPAGTAIMRTSETIGPVRVKAWEP